MLRHGRAVIVGEFMASALDRTRRLYRLRQPEVQHFHRAVGAHFHVRRLQIAMDDALLMRGFKRLGNLLRDGQRLVDVESGHARFVPTNPRPQQVP